MLELTVAGSTDIMERRSLNGMEALEVGVIIGSYILFVFAWIYMFFTYCRRRRALTTPQRGFRLLKSLGGAAHRALLEVDALVEIPTMDIINACSHGIPSFVCAMSTMALTQTLSSEACGGSTSLRRSVCRPSRACV